MHKEILINSEMNECRVAIIENGVLEEFYVERPNDVRLVGSIYKGRVNSFLPGIGAAFVDIGLYKNGFLQYGDTTGFGVDAEEIAEKEGSFLEETKPLNKILKKDGEVLVQVVKEPIGTKGPRLTTDISLPGRYLVLTPNSPRLGVSKRIEAEEERNRLKNILEGLIQKDTRHIRSTQMGFIVRTVGEGKSKKDFLRDARFLYDLWANIKRHASRISAPVIVHQEYDLPLRTIRDLFTEDVVKITVDSKEDFKRIYRFGNVIVPHLKRRIEFRSGDVPLFEKRDIEGEIAKLYKNRVDLKCGGTIVIEQTEGLVAIDVNTGRFVGKRSPEETAFLVNREAAKELARQIRLRDLGGIIVIDFIDMDIPEHCKEVYNVLNEALSRDRARLSISDFSEFGIVEMTRQRMRRSIESVSYRICPYCQGRGNVKSPLTMVIYAIREIKRTFKRIGKKEIEVYLHPDVASRLLKDDRSSLTALEKMFGGKVIVMSDPNMHIEDVRIRSNEDETYGTK